MNKLVLILTFLGYVFLGICQDRVDREEIDFNSKSSKITNASGWAYNNTEGKWFFVMSEDNYISFKNDALDNEKEKKNTYPN